jgi:LmbE family N-acetylglucosaminyl deacetylase
VTGRDAPPGDPGRSGLPIGDLLRSGPVTTDIPVPARVLAIGAHPDDIEFGSGATLAKWANAGCRVHHLILTDGSKGSWDPGADLVRLIADRQHECRAAAAVIDGVGEASESDEDRVVFLHQVDGELVNGVAQRREVARIIRQIRPVVLLGHDPWRRYSLHPDHRAAGFLTVDALVAARDPHFFPDLGLAPHRPDALLLWEPDLPNHIEQSHGFATVKIEALLRHRSQLESTMGIEPDAANSRTSSNHSAEFTAKVNRQLVSHGSLGGSEAAEAFHLMSEL